MHIRVHYLQHVPFEGLGSIQGWLESGSAEISATRLYEEVRFPNTRDIDWLIIMGGPMSVNDDDAYPWLAPEKRFVSEAIASSKVVLGICLGAQVIASALGARVVSNAEPEIGWFAIEPARGASQGPFSLLFQVPLEVFHWHGETFELPPGAVHLARSEACEHQAFSLGERVLGLQFHLETTSESARALVANCRADLVPSRWVQSEGELLRHPERFRRINRVMEALLDSMEGLAV
jgi:GMP synthase-like glutamine amidotransferase